MREEPGYDAGAMGCARLRQEILLDTRVLLQDARPHSRKPRPVTLTVERAGSGPALPERYIP